MLSNLGGTGGHPFYSTLQLSRFFRCSVGLTMWRLFWVLFLYVKVASSRSGLLATALVSKAALLRRRSRSRTRQAWHTHSLWRRKKIRKQNLRHIFRRCVSRKYDNATSARASRLPLKNGCCHFS